MLVIRNNCCALSLLSGSVDDIIEHYKKEQIVEGYNLKDAVSVQVSLSPLTSVVVLLLSLTVCDGYRCTGI